MLLIVSSVLALLIGEGALRLIGFSFNGLPIVQFGWPTPKELRDELVIDPDLLWVTKDYASRLESARKAPPEIVFMGDSCTQFGTYPEKTLAVLAAQGPTLKTGVAFGTGGWTSQQGLWQLERDIVPLHPKVITFYYGWNDHWVALSAPDAEVRPSAFWFWIANHSRIYQLFAAAHSNSRPGTKTRPNRVGLLQYHANLRRLVEVTRGIGGVPVLITAPSNHVIGQEPKYLEQRWVRNLSEVVPLHQAYLQATREVASRTHARLCDIAAAFAEDPQHSSYFLEDGIHLNESGDQKIATVLAVCIREAYAAEQPHPE